MYISALLLGVLSCIVFLRVDSFACVILTFRSCHDKCICNPEWLNDNDVRYCGVCDASNFEFQCFHECSGYTFDLPAVIGCSFEQCG